MSCDCRRSPFTGRKNEKLGIRVRVMLVIMMMRNNEQQQLFEGFSNSCYKIVSPILLRGLIHEVAVYKHFSGALLLVEDVLVATLLETRTTYFKIKLHFLIDQPRTCRIFLLHCIKSILFN